MHWPVLPGDSWWVDRVELKLSAGQRMLKGVSSRHFFFRSRQLFFRWMLAVKNFNCCGVYFETGTKNFCLTSLFNPSIPVMIATNGC
jgi:hypothetical protein